MGAVRALVAGKGDLPTDARAGYLASELVHAARTGAFPRPGALSRQRLSFARAWPTARLTVQAIDAAYRRGPEPSNGRPA